MKWIERRQQEGLRIKILFSDEKQLGFIEYVPGEYAWRPVDADNYFFIHCLFIYPNKFRNAGAATLMIDQVIKEARKLDKDGICVMTSNGPWISTKKVFEKIGFTKVDKRGRFELMCYKLKEDAPNPKLIDWDKNMDKHKGWQLYYADQCPWHDKGAKTLELVATERNIPLKIYKITSALEAKKVPSGFGVFALIKDGKLIEDHYISKRRFENILEKTD
jgi:hypothetical protein